MADIRIKDEFKDEVVGFNNSGLPLGQRSQEDLRYLARLAHENNKSMLRYFDNPPPLEDLQAQRTEKFLQQHRLSSDDE